MLNKWIAGETYAQKVASESGPLSYIIKKITYRPKNLFALRFVPDENDGLGVLFLLNHLDRFGHLAVGQIAHRKQGHELLGRDVGTLVLATELSHPQTELVGDRPDVNLLLKTNTGFECGKKKLNLRYSYD